MMTALGGTSNQVFSYPTLPTGAAPSVTCSHVASHIALFYPVLAFCDVSHTHIVFSAYPQFLQLSFPWLPWPLPSG